MVTFIGGKETPVKRFILIIVVLLICSVGFSCARITINSSTGPKTGVHSYKLSPEMKKLTVFVGDWVYEGEQVNSPLTDLFGEAGSFSGTIEARFILDGSFLETKYEDKNPAGITTIIEITGYDPTEKKYVANGYVSDGSRDTTLQTTSSDGRVWISRKTFTTNIGKEVLLKCILTFSLDWRSYITTEEYSVDGGKTWIHWYKFEARKVP